MESVLYEISFVLNQFCMKSVSNQISLYEISYVSNKFCMKSVTYQISFAFVKWKNRDIFRQVFPVCR
jgi:hypothetical protein